MASSAREPTIYTGTWTNWSSGRFKGAVLTLTQRDGSLLTAFLAIFIAYAASQLWRILCLVVSHSLSAGDVSKDALYLQRQAVFRNASSGATALWSFLQMSWFWRRYATRPWLRLLPFIVFSAAYWITASTASVFSSKISSFAGDEVLISSAQCGQLDGNHEWYRMRGALGGHPFSNSLWSFHGDRLRKSTQYVSECYPKSPNATGHNEIASCNMFVKPNLPLSINYNASCPADLCTIEDQNLLIEARVNSHDDLGLNSPPSERVDLVWTTHCGPLNVEGLKEPYNYTTAASSQAYVKYHVGDVVNGTGSRRNYTNLAKVLDLQQWMLAGSSYAEGAPNLNAVASHYINGSTTNEYTTWYPPSALQQNNADLNLFFLTHNGMLTTSPTNDPWYSAHRLINNITAPSDGVLNEYYGADAITSFLYCKDQFQVCRLGTDGGRNCSSQGSISDAYLNEIRRTGGQPSVLLRLFQAFPVHSMAEIPRCRGLASFSTVWTSIPTGLISDDHWKQDVISWTQQFLASMQGSMVDVATGPRGANMDTVGANDEEWRVAHTNDEKRYCHSQKIRSAAYTNFSILWLSIIIGLCCLTICINWSLEYLITWIDTRRGKRVENQQSYAHLEWKANETLQLQRQAHEVVGSGTWSKCAESLPITAAGQTLACFDINDPEHPRLKRPANELYAMYSISARESLESRHESVAISVQNGTGSGTSAQQKSFDESSGEDGNSDDMEAVRGLTLAYGRDSREDGVEGYQSSGRGVGVHHGHTPVRSTDEDDGRRYASGAGDSEDNRPG